MRDQCVNFEYKIQFMKNVCVKYLTMKIQIKAYINKVNIILVWSEDKKYIKKLLLIKIFNYLKNWMFIVQYTRALLIFNSLIFLRSKSSTI